ncbi:hypothetical protein F4810DRAFT_726527 [Camillea tinctor]|nr:hypothetical protein F4810DRAFT_726527 [Camillea tinctor]
MDPELSTQAAVDYCLNREGLLLWRLFKILPKKKDDAMVEIETTEVRHFAKEYIADKGFIALSQAWQECDESSGTKKILWNGEEKHISCDKYEFLYSIRNNEDRYYWEQNICTADNFLEINTLCRAAFCAFSISDQLIVWLGKQTPLLSLAMDVLSSGRFSECLDPDRLEENMQALEAVDEMVNRKWFRDCMSIYATILTHLKLPFDTEPCKLYFRCGSQELPFSRVYEAWTLWNESPIKDGRIKSKWRPPLFYNIPFFQGLEDFADFRHYAFTEVGVSQIEWIARISRLGFEIKDTKEFLTLFRFVSHHDGCLTRSPVNTMPIKYIYFLTFYGGSNVVRDSKAFSYIRPPYARNPKLSSWIPDIFQLSRRSWPLAEAIDPYRSGLDFENPIWETYVENFGRGKLPPAEDTCLYLQGFVYDTVGWYSDSPDIYEKAPNAHIEREISQHNYRHVMAHVKERWIAGAMPLAAILENEHREALWKTLICARDADGLRLLPNSDMGERFDKLISHWFPPFAAVNRFPLADHNATVADDAEAQTSARLNILQHQAKAAKKAGKPLEKELIAEKKQLKERLAEYRREPWVKEFTDLVVQRSYDRALMTTEEQQTFGLATRGIQRGDLIVVARGALAPVVLRKLDDKKYTVIGDAYVHGIMDGQFLQQAMMQKRPVQTFVLDDEISPCGEDV